MPVFTCRAVLFDLDGVLVDSTACAGRVWAAWAREHGFDPIKMVEFAHGRPTIETVSTVGPNLDAERETADIEQREVNDVEGLRAVPGAKELLDALPPDRYTIVTSGSRRLATARLRAAGLPVPQQMITADDIVNGKPDPEPYLKGAALLGFRPEECLVFEDSPPGIRAGKAAGMQVIAMPTTYKPEALTEGDALIENLAAASAERSATGEINIRVEAAVPVSRS
jgi:sugar-phosphatase